MPDPFDPFHTWLGIPPNEQPPNHYRLLGLRLFEGDPAAIEAAAEERAGRLHAFQRGEHAGLCLKLINEVSAAKSCLLNANRKSGYDRGLRASMQADTAREKQNDQSQRARCRQFIELLEEKDLLPDKLIDVLRKQVAESSKAIPAEAVAKRLIEAGHLTPALAKRLLPAEAEKTPAETPPPAKPQQTRPAAAKPAPSPAAKEEDELELAPLDDEKPLSRRGAEKKPTRQAAAKKAPGKTPSQKTGRPDAKPSGTTPPEQPPAETGASSLLDEELPSLGDAPGGAAMGPLDGLLAAGGLDAAAGGSPLAPISLRGKGLRGLFKRLKKKKPGKKEDSWDSSLMLAGGGTLLVLIVLLTGLVWSVMRQRGDDALSQADEEYHDGAYAQAIHKYSQYLERFPKHHGVSLARVNRGLARLRQVTGKGTSDWSMALDKAKEVLGEIAPEEEFSQAYPELAAMLPKIAEGLATASRSPPDPDLIAQTEEALALLRKDEYVPESLRGSDKIAEIEQSLNLTRREITRAEQLVQAIRDMDLAVAAGNTEQAYEKRQELLQQHPGLADDDKLEKVLLRVSGAQQKKVERVDKQQAAVRDEPADSLSAAVVLAQRTTTSEVRGALSRVVFAVAGGAAYGLDAASGKVLWRRFVGFDTNTTRPPFPPTALARQPGGDVLLVDSARHELLRLDASSGQLRWRHPLGERLDAHPVVAGSNILVATRSGRLVTIDAATGDSSGFVHFPQPLQTAPAVDTGRRLIFQPAEHSNLFLLTGADDAEQPCTQVVHLGHEKGTLSVPPVVVSRLLLVAVNDRAEASMLHVLLTDEEEGIAVVKPVQRFRLTGHVDTAPLVAGRRVLVVTDSGAVSVFEISGTDTDSPLKRFPQGRQTDDQRLVRYPLMDGSRFWLGDVEFTRYDIQASRGRLLPRWSDDENCVFLQPLVVIGETIFHVRRKIGFSGVFVSAVAMDEAKRFWETHLAAAPVTEPMVDPPGDTISVLTSGGALFRLDAAAVSGQTIVDVPTLALQPGPLRRPVTGAVRLDRQRLVATVDEDSEQALVFDPGAEKPVAWQRLPGKLSCRPVLLPDGLLVPCREGQVFLLDPSSWHSNVEPFQPRLKKGVQVAWIGPAAAGAGQIVLADGRSKLYRLKISREPKPHLIAAAQADLSERIVSPIAVAGQNAYAVDAAGMLAAFTLPDLTRKDVLPLRGRPVWGPGRAGSRVLLVTDNHELLCLDDTGNVRWQSAFDAAYGPPAGAPLEIDGGYLLAHTSGVVWHADAESGRELGKVEIGRPLATGPVSFGGKLLTCGRDGSLYEIKLP